MLKIEIIDVILSDQQGWCDVRRLRRRRKKSATKCDCDGAIFKSSSQNSEKCGILLNNLSGSFLSISDEVNRVNQIQ